MSTKQSRFLTQQKRMVGIVAALIVMIIVYLSFLLIKDTPIGEGFVEGKHYFLLENPRRVRGEKIEIVEFFSYACVHCYNFDDDLGQWVESRKENINFIRNPVIANEAWRHFGRAYYTMDALNILDEGHSRLFREIHEGRKNPNSVEKLSALLTQDENIATSFEKMFNSPTITRKINQADQLARRFKIATVPNLVVNGKYLVRSGNGIGLSRMLDVMDYLIGLETAKEDSGESN